MLVRRADVRGERWEFQTPFSCSIILLFCCHWYFAPSLWSFLKNPRFARLSAILQFTLSAIYLIFLFFVFLIEMVGVVLDLTSMHAYLAVSFSLLIRISPFDCNRASFYCVSEPFFFVFLCLFPCAVYYSFFFGSFFWNENFLFCFCFFVHGNDVKQKSLLIIRLSYLKRKRFVSFLSTLYLHCVFIDLFSILYLV